RGFQIGSARDAGAVDVGDFVNDPHDFGVVGFFGADLRVDGGNSGSLGGDGHRREQQQTGKTGKNSDHGSSSKETMRAARSGLRFARRTGSQYTLAGARPQF